MSMNPCLLGSATALPGHVLTRDAVMAGAQKLFGNMDRLLPIYANAGVDQRHSCVPLEWYLQPHGWAERNQLFIENAVELMTRAALDCLAKAGKRLDEVDCIVSVSSTGIATPSLDALVMERLKLRRDVIRLPIFGLGCAGGVLGLARAAAMARAHPGANVLLLVVELCGLTFRANDASKSNVIATALFGDGAAAILLGPGGGKPTIAASGEHCWENSLEVMGWTVENDGLGVVFSASIPELVRSRFRPALDHFLSKHNLTAGLIDRFICHPGGTKVVAALEDALELDSGTLADERQVLRYHGNMSAPTVLFVLARALATGLPARSLVTGLGPGFGAGFVLVEN